MNAPTTSPDTEAAQVTEAAQIDAALAKMQGELTATAKGAKGQVRGNKSYAYSTIADVWDAIREPLAKHGLAITQTEGYFDNFVTLTTTLRHVSGEQIEGSRPIMTVEGAIKDPQAYGSALTYARRYGITAMVGIAPADDDDGASAKAAGHQSMGRTVPNGPRGGQDKTKAADDEIKLRGYPEGGTTTTKRYPRKISGVAMFIDDLEIAVGSDPMNWDINSEGIEIARLGIEKGGRSDLRDRLDNLEIRAEDLARNLMAG